MRTSHGRLARFGIGTLLFVTASSAVTQEAYARRLTSEQARAITATLDAAVRHNPGVVKKTWFLKKASLVNFILPVTIRLLPARDGVGHYVSNDQVGNYATLDLGQSLGMRVIGLGGQVNAEVRFHDSYDSDQLGNVDIKLLPDDAVVTSTSVGLLTNPDTSTASPGHNHVDQLSLNGASSGTFTLTWVDPDSQLHTTAPISAAGLDQVTLTNALQAAIGGNNVFATQTGGGVFQIEFSGKYMAPDSPLNIVQLGSNTTGAPIATANITPGDPGNQGCSGFAGDGSSSDVDLLSKMQPSLNPDTNSVGPNWQWNPLGGTNEKDVVLRTGPLTLSIENPGAEAVVPAGIPSTTPGDYSGNQSGSVYAGTSGGKANLFGLSVDGLPDGNSVDVTVSLRTKINSILRQVDDQLPRPAGQPDETQGNIGAYFNCRQVWTGYVENHLLAIHLIGQLHIAPAITADGRLRIAKIFMASQGPSRQALAACLVPYATFAAGNNTIGDSSYTTSAPWSSNPIGPNLAGGVSSSAAFNPVTAINPDASAAAPDVPCDATGGPLDRNPFNVFARGSISLTQMMQTGAVAAVSGDLTVQRLVGEVIIGRFPQPPPFTPTSASAQLVAGVRVTPGKAGFEAKAGCVSRPFNVAVKGRSMATVSFKLDGRRIDYFPNVIHNIAKVRINPKKYGYGIHHLVATVTFAQGSGTKPKTLKLSFQRCQPIKLQKPRFTG